MQEHVEQSCPHREQVVALTRDQLAGEERSRTQEHVAHHAPCRALFRERTADRFPEIPKYTILEHVGKGGFGVVYRAVHHDRERIEALKVRFGKALRLPSYFENEVHLIADLRHPNIATLFDAQLSSPPQYYTMEFVDGERLNEYIKHQKVSLAERIEIIRTVAQALEYAHGRGVVHRDIKPQNILIDADGQPHIVDFGIATRLELTDESGGEPREPGDEVGPVGTIGYISPEQVAGKRVDARADVFALGALLFHCVTGEPARLARVPERRLKLLRERHVSRPDDLASIVARCVETEPDERYASCRDVAEDLSNYLAGRAVRARPSHSPLMAARRVAAFVLRSYPLTVRTAAVVLAAALLTSAFWAVGSRTLPIVPDGPGQTVIVAFGPSTIEALRTGRIGANLPGLIPNLFGSRSWRMLHGRLLERLAEARPRVVVFDYYFTDCQPQYDEYLLRGIRSIDAPVVVGVGEVDVDGRPVLCESIRNAASGYGWVIGTEPRSREHEYEIVLGVERGFEEPIPGLALSALAATRFPDARVSLRLDETDLTLEMRYRKREPSPGASRWHRRTDKLALQNVQVVSETSRRLAGLRVGDRVGRVITPARSNAQWRSAIIPYEDVLAADRSQLRDWFDNRAVVIGQMIPDIDEHATGRGESAFGCQVHADALDALLTGVRPHAFQRAGVLLRTGAWCALAGLAVSMLPRRRWKSLFAAGVVCAPMFLLGTALAVYSALHVTDPLVIEFAFALSALLAAGSLAFWSKAAHERQHQLSPAAITPDEQGSTVPSTILAETN